MIKYVNTTSCIFGPVKDISFETHKIEMMMLLVNLLKSASIGVGVVIASTGWNIGQMYQIVKNENNVDQGGSDCLYTKYITRDDKNNNGLSTKIPKDLTLNDVMSDLNSMKRSDIIKLFVASSSPSKSSILIGDWNAVLLENNGLVMTSISQQITNNLFGNRNSWNGKKFQSSGIGINRFQTRNNDDNNIIYNHNFDWEIKESAFFGGETLSLDYSNYQGSLSPWKSMKDEVRVLGKTKDGKLIMIGMGCMAWSGGMLNASPFCLFAKDEAIL